MTTHAPNRYVPSDPLGFAFTPTPRRAMQALRSAELSPDNYVVVAFLYERATTWKLAARRSTPELTLSQIAEGIHWTGQLDTLSKRLRRLRDEPERWFDYRIEGRGKYIFTLHPEAPVAAETLSEACPTLEEGRRPSSLGAAMRIDAQLERAGARSLSVISEAADRALCPTTAADCPSSKRSETRAEWSTPPSLPADLVRGAQTSQTNLSMKENLENNRLQEDSTGTFWFPWPDTNGLTSEQAIIACCDALVLEGEAWWVEEDQDGDRPPLSGSTSSVGENAARETADRCWGAS